MMPFIQKFFLFFALFYLTACGGDEFTPLQQTLNTEYGIDTPTKLFSNSNKSEDVMKRFKKAVQNKNVTVTTEKYALDYYNAWMKDKDETHYIVNFNLQTTTSIAKVDNTLLVISHEWVKSSEHYIETIGNGMTLAEYLIDIGSGNITKVN